MNLWSAVSKLKAAAFEVTYEESLAYLSENNLALIDQFRSESTTAQGFVQRRRRCLAKFCGELKSTLNIGRLIDLKNSFSELLMFVKLAERFTVERLPETGEETPDFLIKFHGLDLFTEVKALNVADGAAKLRQIQEDGLAMKIKLEKEINKGAAIAAWIQAIQPHLRNTKPYDRWSTKLVTENLIGKMDQNILSAVAASRPRGASQIKTRFRSRTFPPMTRTTAYAK